MWVFNLALVVSVPCVPKEMRENAVLKLELTWVQLQAGGGNVGRGGKTGTKVLFLERSFDSEMRPDSS